MVKISKKTILAGGLITAVSVLPSCGKYEDGPGFSLASKKSRLTGVWEIESYKENGVDILNNDNNNIDIEIEFEKDGDYQLTLTNTYSGYSQDYTYTSFSNGEWEFSGDKEEIEFDPDNDSDFEWEIQRLTNKELHVEIKDGSDTYELEFEKE